MGQAHERSGLRTARRFLVGTLAVLLVLDLFLAVCFARVDWYLSWSTPLANRVYGQVLDGPDSWAVPLTWLMRSSGLAWAGTCGVVAGLIFLRIREQEASRRRAPPLARRPGRRPCRAMDDDDPLEWEPAPTRDERNLAVICHLSTFAGYVAPVIGDVAGPLAIYLTKRNESPHLRAHAVEALNFQISMLIYLGIAAALMYVLIGFVIFPLLIVLEFVVTIVAAVRAADGRAHRYPISIPFLA